MNHEEGREIAGGEQVVRIKKSDIIPIGKKSATQGQGAKTPRLPNGRFPKGISGNPKGMEKGKVTSIRKALYHQLSKEGVDGTTVAEAIAQHFVVDALGNGKNSFEARKFILKETDGQLPQQINLGGVENNPIEFRDKVDKFKEEIRKTQKNFNVSE